jgi:hypothetical protein
MVYPPTKIISKPILINSNRIKFNRTPCNKISNNSSESVNNNGLNHHDKCPSDSNSGTNSIVWKKIKQLQEIRIKSNSHSNNNKRVVSIFQTAITNLVRTNSNS